MRHLLQNCSYISSTSDHAINALLVLPFCVVITSTIVGNFLALLAVCKIRSTRSISHFFIGCLAISDLFIGLLVMVPMALYTVGVPLSPLLPCRIWQIVESSLNTISVYTLCAVGIDRWMNIERPLAVFTRSRSGNKHAMWFVWIVPISVWVITDYLRDSDNITHVLLAGLLSFYVPIVVLVIVFLRIGFIVRRHSRFVREHGNVGGVTSNSMARAESVSPASERCMKLSLSIDRSPSGRIPTSPYSLNGTQTTSTTAYRKSSNVTFFASSMDKPISIDTAVCEDIPEDEVSNLNTPPTRSSSPRHRHLSQQLTPTLITRPDRHHRLSEREASKTLMPVKRNDRKLTLPQMTLPAELEHASMSPKPPASPNSQLHKTAIMHRCARSTTALEVMGRMPMERKQSMRESLASLTSTVVEVFTTDGIRAEWRATKAITMVVCVLLVCWLPFLILWPVHLFYSNSISHRVYLGAVWCNYLSAAINPWLYTIFTPRAKKALAAYVPSSFRRHKKNSDPSKQNSQSVIGTKKAQVSARMV